MTNDYSASAPWRYRDDRSGVIVSDRLLALCDFDHVAAKALQEIDFWSATPGNQAREGWHYIAIEDIAFACFHCSDLKLKQKIKRAIAKLKQMGLIESCLLKDLGDIRTAFDLSRNPRTLVVRSCPDRIAELWPSVADQWGWGCDQSRSPDQPPEIENVLPWYGNVLPSDENVLPTYISSNQSKNLSANPPNERDFLKDFSEAECGQDTGNRSSQSDREIRANDDQSLSVQFQLRKKINTPPARTEIKSDTPWRDPDGSINAGFCGYLDQHFARVARNANQPQMIRGARVAAWIAKHEAIAIDDVWAFWQSFEESHRPSDSTNPLIEDAIARGELRRIGESNYFAFPRDGASGAAHSIDSAIARLTAA